jgi:hypothetical protein
MCSGGGSGIRTHDTVSRIHAFQACAFSHSAIPPAWRRTIVGLILMTTQCDSGGVGVRTYRARGSGSVGVPGDVPTAPAKLA